MGSIEKDTQNKFTVLSLTYFHLEVVEGMLVDVLHLVHQPHGVVGQRPDVCAPHLVVRGVVKAGRRHVGGADGLDLLQLTELILADDLMVHLYKVCAFSHKDQTSETFIS